MSGDADRPAGADADADGNANADGGGDANAAETETETVPGRPCPFCGASMAKRHCKYVCPDHGVVYDCSDTFW